MLIADFLTQKLNNEIRYWQENALTSRRPPGQATLMTVRLR